MQAMLEETTPIDGRMLSLKAMGDAQLDATLLTALYGASASRWGGTDKFALVDDGCIYLSEIQHPFELAVFRCIDESDVSGGRMSVLGVCASRLEAIQTAWQGSSYDLCAQNAILTYYGTYVILIVADNPTPILKAAQKAIRAK